MRAGCVISIIFGCASYTCSDNALTQESAAFAESQVYESNITGVSTEIDSPSSTYDADNIEPYGGGTIVKGVVIDPHGSTSGSKGYIYVLFTNTGNTYEDTGFGIMTFSEYDSGGTIVVSHVSGANQNVYEKGNLGDDYLYSYYTGNAPSAGHNYYGNASFEENQCGIAIDTSHSKIIITGSEEIYNNSHSGIAVDACAWEYNETAGGVLGNSGAPNQSQIVWASASTIGIGSGAIGPVAVDPGTGDVFAVWSDGTTIVEGRDNGTYGFIPIYDGTDGNHGILEDSGGPGVAWYSNISDISRIGVTNSATAGWYNTATTYYPLIVVLNSSNGITANNQLNDYYFTTTFNSGSTIPPFTANGWGQDDLYLDPGTGDFAVDGSFVAQVFIWNNSNFAGTGPLDSKFTSSSSSPDSFAEPTGAALGFVVLAPDSTSALNGPVDLAVVGVGSTYDLWGEF